MNEIISTMLRMLQAGLLVSLLAIPHFAQTARPDHPGQPSSPPVTIDFRDIASEAGLTAENVSGDADNKRYILETTGDGVAICDLDNDGLMDVLLVNATPMDGKGRAEHAAFSFIQKTAMRERKTMKAVAESVLADELTP